MIAHDPNCTDCRGRGHRYVSPTALGWIPTPEPRRWFVKGGGVRTFLPAEPEHIMIACDCARQLQSPMTNTP